MEGLNLMKIYNLASINTGYDTLVLENRSEIFPKYFNPNFNGNVINEWGEIKVKTNKQGKQTDAPSFLTGMPIISRRAAQVFSANLNGKIQLLPIIHDQHDYVIVNVINVIEALDYRNAEIKRLSSGAIQDIVKYSFNEQLLRDELLFKIPEYPETKIFVTGKFKEIIELNNLIGFRFDLVWNSVDARTGASDELPSIDIPRMISSKTYSYREAAELLLSGKAIASGVWKLQQDNMGEVMLGEWVNGAYQWIAPYSYPPIFHELIWYEVERSTI